MIKGIYIILGSGTEYLVQGWKIGTEYWVQEYNTGYMDRILGAGIEYLVQKWKKGIE